MTTPRDTEIQKHAINHSKAEFKKDREKACGKWGKEHRFLEASQTSSVCPSGKIQHAGEDECEEWCNDVDWRKQEFAKEWCNDTDWRKPEFAKETLSQCHIIHHKCHKD